MLLLFQELKKTAISSYDINYLNNLEERDGFYFIQDSDYENLCYFIDENIEDIGNVTPLLTDNNGNYICVISGGEFLGVVVLLSLDESGLVRLFKNIPTMVDMINNNKEFWDIYNFPNSYYS